MMKLENFVNMMTGHFDNREQFHMMQKEGKVYPYAEHVNTVCNDKIDNLPKDFTGRFVVEESYYETAGKRHASPHLFLITDLKSSHRHYTGKRMESGKEAVQAVSHRS